LGLIYGPTADITLKASWGRSFKAPTLFQLYQARQAVLLDTSLFGDPNAPKGTALISGGGNPNLDPERARTWTTSLGFHPEAMPGLDAELTLFHIDYTDRVEQPINDYSIVFNNPLYAPFVDQSPTPEKQAEIITGAQFYNYTGAAYDPSKVIALLYTSYANVARQKIKGVDLSGSYRFSAGANHLEIRGSASWLDSTQQNLPGQAESDLAGTLYSPAKINSRLGGVWIRGGFTASLFANYTRGVTNPADGRKTASFPTFDAVLRYATKAQSGAWSGWVFSLSVDNLLDRAPPLNKTSAPIYTPYDSTNYSAIGRFANLSITKRW
jgi:outer membrane receptor protein involved in Fe transport